VGFEGCGEVELEEDEGWGDEDVEHDGDEEGEARSASEKNTVYTSWYVVRRSHGSCSWSGLGSGSGFGFEGSLGVDVFSSVLVRGDLNVSVTILGR
jgi:hypothetical protein